MARKHPPVAASPSRCPREMWMSHDLHPRWLWCNIPGIGHCLVGLGNFHDVNPSEYGIFGITIRMLMSYWFGLYPIPINLVNPGVLILVNDGQSLPDDPKPMLEFTSGRLTLGRSRVWQAKDATAEIISRSCYRFGTPGSAPRLKSSRPTCSSRTAERSSWNSAAQHGGYAADQSNCWNVNNCWTRSIWGLIST